METRTITCKKCGAQHTFEAENVAALAGVIGDERGWKDWSPRHNRAICPDCMRKLVEINQITDEDSHRTHYTSVPNVVWLRCENVWEFTLWCVVKQIAWETSQCLVTTPELAVLAMMSTGQVTRCRKSLLKKGLLKGARYKDVGYENAVWHLSIPNLWAENEQQMGGMGNKDKVEAKREQRTEKRKPQPKREGSGRRPKEAEDIPSGEEDESPY